MFLEAYSFQVIYVPGKTNQAADALSKHPLPRKEVNAINAFSVTYDWSQAQGQDKFANEIKLDIKHQPNFTVINNTIYRIIQNKWNPTRYNLYIAVPQLLISDVITLHHNFSYGGHFGYKKINAEILQNRLWWKYMEGYIKKHCTFAKNVN